MAPRAGLNKLPPRTVLYLLIGSGVIVLFVLLGIIPMQKRLQQQDRDIEQKKFRIEEQHALHPIYLKMLAIAKAGGTTAPKLPDREGLGQKAVSEITDSLAQLIIQAGLEAQSVVPDPSSLGKGSKSLAVNIHVRGSLERFRGFLDALAMLPSYENVETLKVQPGNGPRDYTITVWLTAE
jgi:Tfp pilus assembly protein PilO